MEIGNFIHRFSWSESILSYDGLAGNSKQRNKINCNGNLISYSLLNIDC